jgi:hypothetical protein
MPHERADADLWLAHKPPSLDYLPAPSLQGLDTCDWSRSNPTWACLSMGSLTGMPT